MGKTAVGLYASSAAAREVMNDLVDAGFSRNTIRIMHGDTATSRIGEWFEGAFGVGDGVNINAAYAGNADGVYDAVATLTAVGVPSVDAADYEQALLHGHALVSVSTSDEDIDEAVEIMSRHNILDVHSLAGTWDTSAYATSTASGRQSAIGANEQAAIPVIEEEVRVGKRQVETGGVRVRSVVTETPVQETVNLRQEHVQVERHPVNRPVAPGDVDALRDRTIEIRETAEEAVIDKQARVVEEVVVSKDVDTRQQTVQDTVRRTDVEVENLDGRGVVGWDAYANDFRSHYNTTFGSRGHDYAYYEPAYRYGYELSNRNDWHGRSWADIEADARRGWDPVHGPWDEFKEAVRYSWQRITS